MVSILGGTEDSARLACLRLLIYNVKWKTVHTVLLSLSSSVTLLEIKPEGRAANVEN